MNDQPYILTVDDDPDIIEGILMILETQNYRLATANDGKKCMEMILSTVIEDASHRRYELETGMRMDIQGYIQKPAKPDDLIENIAKIIINQ